MSTRGGFGLKSDIAAKRQLQSHGGPCFNGPLELTEAINRKIARLWFDRNA